MRFEEKYKLTDQPESSEAAFAKFAKDSRWKELVAGVYDSGIFTLCDTGFDNSSLASWDWLIGEKTILMGYLAWGDFIYISIEQREILLVIVQEGGKVSLGDNLESVFDYNLAAERFYSKMMLPDKFKRIQAHLGALSYGQCFIHSPWPMLGNPERDENYRKGNFTEYVDLVGQTWPQLRSQN